MSQEHKNKVAENGSTYFTTVTDKGERVTKLTRKDGSVITIVAPPSTTSNKRFWERGWIHEGDVDLEPIGDTGLLNVSRSSWRGEA